LFGSSNVVEVLRIVEITEKLSSGRVAWREAGLLGELGKQCDLSFISTCWVI